MIGKKLSIVFFVLLGKCTICCMEAFKNMDCSAKVIKYANDHAFILQESNETVSSIEEQEKNLLFIIANRRLKIKNNGVCHTSPIITQNRLKAIAKEINLILPENIITSIIAGYLLTEEELEKDQCIITILNSDQIKISDQIQLLPNTEIKFQSQSSNSFLEIIYDDMFEKNKKNEYEKILSELLKVN